MVRRNQSTIGLFFYFKKRPEGQQSVTRCDIYTCWAADHSTRHNSIPPIFRSTQSLASSTPLSVLRKRHSPGFVRPLTQLAVFPLTIFSRSRWPSHILCFGLLSIFIVLSTGTEFQYFKPSHSRRDATFACVMVASAASGDDSYA